MKERTTRKSILLAGVLFAAVTAAVASLAAQEPQERSEGTRAPGVFSFDARGGQLGVMVRNLEAADLAGPVTGGVRIAEVQPDSAAALAGLQPGDIVTTFDSERVRSTQQFARLVRETPEGRPVALAIVRDGRTETLEVTLEQRGSRFEGDGPWPEVSTFRFEHLEPQLRALEPHLREFEPRLREMEPRLREQLRTMEPRLREMDPDIRERLTEIERMLKELLDKM